MKLFVKKKLDGKFHVFLDDPEVENFQKIDESANCNEFCDGAFVVLYDHEAKNKKLYGIKDGMLFCVVLDMSSALQFIGNNKEAVCAFSRGEEFYTMEFDGEWTEQHLGKKHKLHLGSTQMALYGKVDHTYFLKDVGNKLVELSHCVGGKLIVLGTYAQVNTAAHHARLVCIKANGDCDIFNPESTEPAKGLTNESFEAVNTVFTWSGNQWICLRKKAKLFCKNAAFYQEAIVSENEGYFELYRIENGAFNLVIKGEGKILENRTGFCINDMIYRLDEDTKKLGFDEPQPTFRKALKTIFKGK